VLFLEARLEVTSARVVNEKQNLPGLPPCLYKRAGKQRLWLAASWWGSISHWFGRCILGYKLVSLTEWRNTPGSHGCDGDKKQLFLWSTNNCFSNIFQVRTSEIQADSASLISKVSYPKCPLIVDGFEGYDCTQSPCRIDDDCSGPAQMCCSNGCVRTCFSKSNPPLRK
jgi:hypothetical protein